VGGEANNLAAAVFIADTVTGNAPVNSLRPLGASLGLFERFPNTNVPTNKRYSYPVANDKTGSNAYTQSTTPPSTAATR
jgi:hypothetical protein